MFRFGVVEIVPNKDGFSRRPGVSAVALGLTAAAAVALVIGVVSTVTSSVGGDAATTGPSILVSVVGVSVAALAAALGFLAYDRLQSSRQADRVGARLGTLQAVLDSAPGAWFAWTTSGFHAQSDDFASTLGGDRIADLAGVIAALAPLSGAAVELAVAALVDNGHRFRLPVGLADGDRHVELVGARGANTDDGEPFFVLWVTDITVQVRSQRESAEALSSAEHRVSSAARRQSVLEAVLDTVPVPVWLRDAGGRISWVNQAYARGVDATKADVSANQIELVGPSAVFGGAVAAPASEPESESRVRRSEDRHIVIAGERRLMRVTELGDSVPADPVDTASGDAAAGEGPLVGYALDLTDVEDAARERERHIAAHATVLENLKSAIAIFGPDKRLTFFNQAYVQLWGFDEAWLATHPTMGEVLEDLRARRRLPEFADFGDFRRNQQGLFTSLIEPDEDWMHLPDGTTLRVLITPHPFGGLMFVLEDVTSSLTLERSYNTLMAVQRESLDNLAEGIAVFGDDGRLQLTNPAFRKIWSLKPDDVQGNPHVSEVLERTRAYFDDGVDWPLTRSRMIAWSLEREPQTGRMDRVDGSILQYSTVPLPDSAVLHSYLDVTDSARVEQALRESNQALETADRLKSEFIANVSYQLRTPLNAIMGFAEILDHQYFGRLNDRQTEYTRSIVDASQRLLALINDILDIATIEAGYMALELRHVLVEEILRGVYDLTREWAGQQRLQISVDCPAQVGAIEADDRRLKQALYNLVSNSVKFTPPGGRITLSAWRRENEIGIVVSDTGIGIPREDQDRVFGRFERGHSHLRQTGVGLGLALVKSFIEMHGGRIELTSAPGTGTTVTCVVPTHPLAAYADAADGDTAFPMVIPFPMAIPPPD